MSRRAIHAAGILVVIAAVIGIEACGGSGNPINICPLASSSSCGCGPASIACLAPAYLYAAGIDSNVSVFPVNAASGALSPAASTTPAAATLGMAAVGNQFLYLSNPQPNAASEASIDAWSVNLGTGALTTVSGSPFSLGPLSIGQGLAANNAAQVLYVADAGRIDALHSDSTGALTPLSSSPYLSGGNVYLTLDPQNRFLFASNDDPPGSVFAFTVDGTSGGLTAVAGSAFTISSSAGNVQPGAIAVDMSGQYVYTVLPATNQIAAFSIVSSSGALNPVPGSPFATGTSPVALAAANGFLYVSNAKDGTTSGFSIDGTSGALTSLSRSPFLIPAGPLTTDPAGRFLFASTAAGMMAFSIDSSTGALTPTGLPVSYGGASALTYVQ